MVSTHCFVSRSVGSRLNVAIEDTRSGRDKDKGQHVVFFRDVCLKGIIDSICSFSLKNLQFFSLKDVDVRKTTNIYLKINIHR